LIEDAQMSRYLIWVEGHPNGTGPGRAAAVAAASPKDSLTGRSKRKKKRKHDPVAVPVAPPPGWPASGGGDFDVELVPPPSAAPPAQLPKKAKRHPASPGGPARRRGWLWALAMLGLIGAIAAGAAIAYFTQQ
jgi:hypothetical protein